MQLAAVAQGAAHLAQLLRNAADCAEKSCQWASERGLSNQQSNTALLICFSLLKYLLLKNVGIKKYRNQAHLQADSWSYICTITVLLDNIGKIKTQPPFKMCF